LPSSVETTSFSVAEGAASDALLDRPDKRNPPGWPFGATEPSACSASVRSTSCHAP
jgi:hypothetical protein